MDYETISDKDIRKLFASLIKTKTLIRLQLAGTDYEQLTMMTGFRRKLSRVFLLLGYPDGFEEAAAGQPGWKIDYEFTGEDKIPYVFTTSGGEIYRGQLCVPFPPAVTRKQRRKYFRVAAPEGTIVAFKYGEGDCREAVLDVSVGGALVALVRLKSPGQGGLPFTVGETLEDVELTFPPAFAENKIKIKRASVVRFDHGQPQAATCCGLEFVEIDPDHLKALTDFIYAYQRKFLRNRLRPNL